MAAVAKLGATSLLLSALVVLPAGTSRAATYTLVLDHIAGDGNAPSGDITATFSDLAFGVGLTLDLTQLAAQEFISDMYFNFDGSAEQLAALTFTRTGINGPAANTITG